MNAVRLSAPTCRPSNKLCFIFSFQVEPIGNGRLSFILEMMTLFQPCRDKVNKLLKSRLKMTYSTRWGL